MKGFILLTVLLLSGYKINLIDAITIGDTCVTNGALAANPIDNTQFFYCLNNIVYLGSCTNGRYFDPNTAQCLLPGSNYPGTNYPGTNYPGTNYPGNPFPIDNNPGITYPGPVNCYGNNYATFPFPGDNTRYYYCVNNQALLVQCPTNSIFNMYTQTCTTGSALPTPSSSLCAPGVNALIATGCQTYILCQNGIASPQTCPNGWYFQPTAGTCGPNAPPACGNNSESYGSCSTEGAVEANNSTCQSYLVCTASKWTSVSCPAGYYFSPTTLTCGPIAPSSCNNNNNNQDTNYYPPIPNYPGIPTYPNYPGYPGYPGYPTNTGNNGVSICSSTPNGIMADSTNCQRYYYCMNGIPYSMVCPNGYYFNPATGSCGANAPETCASLNINNYSVQCPAFAEVTVADPNNCKNYILCSNGLGTVMTCGPGLFYSIVDNTCSFAIPDRCN